MLALIMDGAIHSTRVLNQDNSLCEDNSSSNLVSPTTGSVMIGNINELNDDELVDTELVSEICDDDVKKEEALGAIDQALFCLNNFLTGMERVYC